MIATTMISTHFGIGFSKEGHGKHVILNTKPHNFARIACDGSKIDSVLPDPRLEFHVSYYRRSVAFFQKAFTKCNIWLYVATRANGQTSDSQRQGRLETEDRRRNVVEDDWAGRYSSRIKHCSKVQ